MTIVKTVTATTTAQSLAGLIPALPGGVPLRCRELTLQVSPGASGTLYVGGPTTATSGESIELAVGQTWTVRSSGNSLDLGSVWLLASAGTIRANVALEVQ